MDVYCFANHLVKLLFCIYYSYCVEVGLCYDCLEKDHGSDVDVKLWTMVRGK